MFVAAVVIAVILLMMCAFQVKYTETVVVTRVDQIQKVIKPTEAGADVKASAIISHIMNAADAFASGAKQHDDMTLVVLKVCA